MKITNKSDDRDIVEAAYERFNRDGEIEIDRDVAEVSRGADNGAYVQAWVWVYFDGSEDEQ